jgi:hypothetical protein
MSFYLFRLETIDVVHTRGVIPDDDVVTFSILVNQVDRGHGSGLFPDLAAGSVIPASAVPVGNRLNIDSSWTVGPLAIDPGDLLHVVYSGTNISDNQLTSLSTADQDALEIRLLDAVAAAALTVIAPLGAVAATVAAAVASALSAIGDPVGKFLGFKPQGPCNGPVFSDAVEFSGSGLDNLALSSPSAGALPSLAFTQTHDDTPTHNTSICGAVAETNITFSVIRQATVSTMTLLAEKFPRRNGAGLRQLAGKPEFTLFTLLGLRA